MSLTLKVLSFKNQPITEITSVAIGMEGGSIGRSEDNTLVLPDTEKFVSRHHASISYENGCYYLSDSSLSGVFINDQPTPLINATQRIDNQTRLKIGEYELGIIISDEPVIESFPFIAASKETFDDFPFPDDPDPFITVAATEVDYLPNWEDAGTNSLMEGNFSGIDEWVEKTTNSNSDAFESGLKGNQSPLSDSYQAPGILPTPFIEEVPDNFSFDDFFSDANVEVQPEPQPFQSVNKSTSDDDFDAFLGAAISEMSQADPIDDFLKQNNEVPTETVAIVSDSNPVIEPIRGVINPESNSHHKVNIINNEDVSISEPRLENIPSGSTDSDLFNEFLQGADIAFNPIGPERQKETLNRIGQIFRKLIDGTVAVLRSRSEFKSLCRVNMTVISATNNNPLKFTVSTDDVLRQLLDNKTEGFLGSTAAIEESFTDIMNHQLAMQAGIQASLTDLLKTFDPKVIEKQFEQGIVLQKKAKCWDKLEETYRNTVEDAVENFYGDAFVKAYEQQIRQLTQQRKK